MLFLILVAYFFYDNYEPFLPLDGVYCPSQGACSKIENSSKYKMCDSSTKCLVCPEKGHCNH